MGLKDSAHDFAVVVSEVPAVSAAVYTKSRFAGPSVVLSRADTAAQRSRGMVVLSRNAFPEERTRRCRRGPAGTSPATRW
ncbi:bifunctional ornithine acetyltransferase/N-acetylglutamate synthase [Kitasatospora indigofera]